MKHKLSQLDRAGVLQKYDVFWTSGPKGKGKKEKNRTEMLDAVHKHTNVSR